MRRKLKNEQIVVDYVRKRNNKSQVATLNKKGMKESIYFYRNLPKCKATLVDLFEQEQSFVAVPEDWQIIMADVENSTQAVKNGLHQEVNLTATGSIVAVLNTLKSIDKKIKIPYFFGGDGATFIVPPEVLDVLMEVLENFRHHVKENFYLSLKVGSFPISKVYANNQTIRIAKLKVNPVLTIPIILGNGLKEAERIIKSHFIDESINPKNLIPVNLEGMECRWQEIKSPSEEDKIICLLINCKDDKLQQKVYHEILKSINTIFGSYAERHPISTNKLKLDLRVSKMQKEMYARLGRNKLSYLLKNWLITIFGSFYFANFKKGKAYLQKVYELSYTTMIDGSLNTVISGTQAEVDRLLIVLDKLESEKKIIYGIHLTYASIMSCYVEDRKARHIHFIDGAEGGYTSAASMYKAKNAA